MGLHRATKIVIALAMLLSFGFVNSQELGLLSQKLLLENTIQQRVTSALSKILDESQFVIDVDIELEFSSGQQIETVYRTTDGRIIPSNEQTVTEPVKSEPFARTETGERSVANPFPIPGFPIIPSGRTDEQIRALDPEEAEIELDEDVSADEDFDLGDEGSSTETITSKTEGLPRIKKMDLNIILEDGVTPDLIANVRQVATIAARFDRERGDVLTITTATFKDGRAPAEVIATAVMPVKTEQTETLEKDLAEVQQRNEELMKEIRDREIEYLNRSEEERKKALDDLAQVQNERAKDLIFLQQQREEQTGRLQDGLLQEIAALRTELTTGGLSRQEEGIKTLQAQSLQDSLIAMRIAFEAEKARLQEQISMAMTTRDTEPPGGIGGIWAGNEALFIIGGLLLLSFIIIMVILATGRNRNQVPPMGMAYPGGYPPQYRRPRPKKKKRRPVSKEKNTKDKEVEETKEEPVRVVAVAEIVEPVAEHVEPAEPITPTRQVFEEPELQRMPSTVDIDPEVLRSEIKSMRQSIVSMSVGRQETASRILNDWLQQADTAPSTEPAENGGGDEDIGAALGEEES